MRICGFYIDGFGIYCNQSIQGIPDGLVLFTGKNEGGKTTLMEFIRTILFGPPRKSKNDYQPLRGGAHGGRLRIAMQDGRFYVVDRLGKKATITEEGKLSEQSEPSERLLSRIDRQTFERIFAIGLKDLEGLDFLSHEGVRGRILAASAGVGAASVPSIMSDIKDELDKLYKKSGRNPKINQFAKRLSEIKTEIRDLQREASNYGEFRHRLDSLEEQVRTNKSESRSIGQKLKRIEQLEQARSPWVKLCEAQGKLDELEYAKNFPPKGLERFERLKEEIEETAREKSDLESKAQQIEIKLSNVAVDENIISNRDSVEALRNEREKLSSAINDLPGIKSKTHQEEDKFQKQLRDLGTDWTSKRLAEVDTSVQTRHRVQKFARDLDSAERKYEQAQIHERNLQDAEKNAKIALDDAKVKFETCPVPSITNKEELKRRQDIVRKIRSLFHQQENLSIQLNAKSESLQKENNELKSLESQIMSHSRQLPSWAWIVSLSAGIVFTILAIVLVVLKYYVGGLLFLILIIPLIIRSVQKRQANDENERIRQIQIDMQRRKGLIEQLSKSITDLEASIKEIPTEVDQLAQSMGFERPGKSDEIDKIETTLEQANDALRDWIMLEQKKNEIEKNWQDTSKLAKKAEQETKEANEKLQSLKEEWKQWITQKGFNEITRPEEFEVILQMVDKARVAESSLQDSKLRVDQMETYIVDIRKRICDALVACNFQGYRLETPGLADAGVAEIDSLVRSLDTAIKNQQKRDNLQRELDEINGTLKKQDNKLDTKQTDLSKLLQKSGAEDEENFLRIADAYEELRRCKQQFEANSQTLMTIAGNAEALEALESELNETDPLSLLSEKERLDSRLTELGESISTDDREIGSLRKTLDDMVQDDKLSTLLLEQKTLHEELSDAVRRWTTLVTVRYLMDQARGIYERERQPKVIQEATRFVNVMTDRPYRLVMPAGDSSDIQLEDTETLARKNELGWSSGLADQVYLAIRFGLAHDFSEHIEPLPIILDDVLVRFDPERQLGTAKVILNLAQNHQVLMFTCHPLTREIIENAFDETGLRDTVALTHYRIDNGEIEKV
jgi:uncharacterized protein YhaN